MKEQGENIEKGPAMDNKTLDEFFPRKAPESYHNHLISKKNIMSHFHHPII